MKFSEKWLREWVDPQVDRETLAEQLTMAGLEVDAIEAVAPAFEGVVVGEVEAVEPHPDADKLNVCQVNVAQDEPLSIVCGAANVRPGLRVPCAVVGAKLPGDFKIKKAKLRGVPSFGMLCSAKELGLAESAEGLMELPAEAPVGRDIREYLQLDDVTIELGLTPNRGDCLGLAGIAREVGVLNRCAVKVPSMETVAEAIDERLAVTLEALADCPRYVGRVLRGINPLAETPMWMQERLRRSGIRSLGPAVDITNYVLLELGQPMHAFDLEKLSGGICVRRARSGERLGLLNGSEVELDEETLVIADANGPLAMAGVMGGEASAVGDQTSAVFLESAFFSPDSLAGRARRYGLHTDSSHRFERGVDPQMQRQAMERATALFLEIMGGEAGPLVEVSSEAHLPRRTPFVLRKERLARVLGMQLDDAEVGEILSRLGLAVTAEEGGWQVTAPSFRFDLALEVDLIEEVGRIYGYNRLPSSRPQGALEMQPRSEAVLGMERLRQLLVHRGYQEAITYSFVDPAVQRLIVPDAEEITLSNPISAEMAVMRASLWPGLLQALTHNTKRQQERVLLFESGLRFVKQGTETKQENMIAGVACGSRLPEQWASPAAPMDFYDAKGDVEALLALGGHKEQAVFEAAVHPALHPGQTARISLEGDEIGWIGTINPMIASKLDTKGGVVMFELSLDALRRAKLPAFSELSKFPAIRRDIAIVVDRSVSAFAITQCIRQAAPDTLRELKLFDLYEGERIDSGRKSIALGLTLQAGSRTLTDDEVDAAMESIVAALNAELEASLRD